MIPNNQAVVPGSLTDLALTNEMSLADAFLDAHTIVLVDVSGSMATEDGHGTRQRYTVACDELKKLQAHVPGKIAVIAFSTTPVFAPSGIPPFLRGGTDLAKALKFVKPADGTVDFIVISDGIPDSEADALKEAKTFTSKISTVYVGPEYDRSGAYFLEKLAKAGGGIAAVANKVEALAEKIETLLLQSAG